MHKELIIQVFEKARSEALARGDKNPSLISLAEAVSDHVEEITGWKLGERSFRDYFRKAQELEESAADINIKQVAVITGLCRFLGYDGYEDYCNRGTTREEDPGGGSGKSHRNRGVFPKNKLLLGIAGTGILLLFWVFSANQQRWMLWQGDQYSEVDFDAGKLREGSLKEYREDRIRSFKKITPDCSTRYFKGDGVENLWYGKNPAGELEYFTDLGRHPVTGKTLKPITKYMIRQYICPEYK